MGIRSNTTGRAFTEFQRTANAHYDRYLDDVEFVVEEAMRDGATEMQHLISIRGVHNTVPNFDGRIQSSEMIDKVTYRVSRRGDKITGQFGWLPGTGRERYFGWQEDGTLLHGEPMGDPDPRKSEKGMYPESRGIRPMLALFDAHMHAAERLNAELPKRHGGTR